MVAPENVVLDKVGGGLLGCTEKVVVLKKNAVLKGLVPSLDWSYSGFVDGYRLRDSGP